MQIDLKQNSKGAWFPYFGSKVEEGGGITYYPPEDPKDRVYINPPLAAEKLEEIYAQTRTRKSEFVVNPKTRQMERVSYIDQTPDQARREFEMIFCEIIGDFELTDTDGERIACTPENKIQLMRHQEFGRFVNRCLQLLDLSEAERKAALEKN